MEGQKQGKKVSEQEPEDPTTDPAQQIKPVGPQPKLTPNMPLDTWVDRFKNEKNVAKYKQFKNKSPEKREQMAWAAYYDAHEPKRNAE